MAGIQMWIYVTYNKYQSMNFKSYRFIIVLFYFLSYDPIFISYYVTLSYLCYLYLEISCYF